MRQRTEFSKHALIFGMVVIGLSLSVALAGCSSPQPAKQEQQGPQRYPLSGRVVSVDKAKQLVTVDAGDIPGFMMAMTMGYSVKDPSQLDSLSPQDQIKADVVVNKDQVYLENIVVSGKAAPVTPPAASTPAPAKQ
jgi:Cu/Ag efflux protein CusF